ncbi:putative odorant receptor 92a [Maniola jurtina]|uniref:putative odorant receptor 92a n=1 Tax=Maniola jurtina TaxID=191418 RepID=UPI001E68E1B4|nr:putative odorant receptor 92a [Maniola jurtina]
MKLNSKDEFDDSIELTKKAFMISGFELGETKYNFIKWFFHINILWLYLDVFGEFSWLAEGMRMGKGLDELSMVAPCTAICLLASVKILPVFLNKQTFQKAVHKLRSIHPDEEESEDVDREIVIESQKYLKSVNRIFFFTTLVVIIMFSCEPFMLIGFAYYNTGEVKLLLPFPVKYFFDAYANTTIWSFMYVHQVWSSVIVCVFIFAADTLFYAFCTYLRMHFRILGRQFENFVSPSPEETRKNMRKCVNKHQELIELVNLLEILYSKSTLFNITSSSVLLCLSGFNIVVVQKTGTVLKFASFLMLSLSQVFLLCYFGDLLMSSSIELSQTVYSCRWYDVEPAIRRSVLIILIRSQKPCKVTACNFADLNLSAFSTILSRSYSCFALLKTMFD